MRSADAVGPAVLRLLDEERQVRDRADGALSTLKALLANAEWLVECRRSDLVQLDRLLSPPQIEGSPRLEVVKRPPPPGPAFVDPIIYPAGRDVAGEEAA
jgi:hypothetical protein